MTIPFSNLVPFMGVVQAAEDPTYAGRLKVRCFGFHPPVDNAGSGVPTEFLPWAVLLNNTLGAVESPTPKPGELVFGFFLDGRDAQFPMVIGSIPAYAIGSLNNAWAEANDETIARAPRGTSQPWHSGMDVEATNFPAAQGMPLRINDATGASSVQFPAPELGGRAGSSLNSNAYGGSHVYAGEHTTMYHDSGTVVQISKKGDVIIQSLGDKYESSTNSAERVEENKDVMVQGKYNVRVMGNCNLTVAGNMNHTVAGDYNLRVGGKYNVLAGEQVEVQGAKVGIHGYADSVDVSAKKGLFMLSETEVSITAQEDAYITAEDTLYLKAKLIKMSSTADFELFAKRNMAFENEGTGSWKGGKNMYLDSDQIDLNSGGAPNVVEGDAKPATPPSMSDLGKPPSSSAVPADPINLLPPEDSFHNKDGGGIDGADVNPDPDAGDTTTADDSGAETSNTATSNTATSNTAASNTATSNTGAEDLDAFGGEGALVIEGIGIDETPLANDPTISKATTTITPGENSTVTSSASSTKVTTEKVAATDTTPELTKTKTTNTTETKTVKTSGGEVKTTTYPTSTAPEGPRPGDNKPATSGGVNLGVTAGEYRQMTRREQAILRRDTPGTKAYQRKQERDKRNASKD